MKTLSAKDAKYGLGAYIFDAAIGQPISTGTFDAAHADCRLTFASLSFVTISASDA